MRTRFRYFPIFISRNSFLNKTCVHVLAPLITISTLRDHPKYIAARAPARSWLRGGCNLDDTHLKAPAYCQDAAAGRTSSGLILTPSSGKHLAGKAGRPPLTLLMLTGGKGREVAHRKGGTGGRGRVASSEAGWV